MICMCPIGPVLCRQQTQRLPTHCLFIIPLRIPLLDYNWQTKSQGYCKYKNTYSVQWETFYHHTTLFWPVHIYIYIYLCNQTNLLIYSTEAGGSEVLGSARAQLVCMLCVYSKFGNNIFLIIPFL